MNRFKGLDLVDRVPEELWTEVRNFVQEAVTKTTSKKKKCKNAKQLSEKTLQIVEKRRNNRKKKKQLYWSGCTDGVITHLEPRHPGMRSQVDLRKHHYEQS